MRFFRARGADRDRAAANADATDPVEPGGVRPADPAPALSEHGSGALQPIVGEAVPDVPAQPVVVPRRLPSKVVAGGVSIARAGAETVAARPMPQPEKSGIERCVADMLANDEADGAARRLDAENGEHAAGFPFADDTDPDTDPTETEAQDMKDDVEPEDLHDTEIAPTSRVLSRSSRRSPSVPTNSERVIVRAMQSRPVLSSATTRHDEVASTRDRYATTGSSGHAAVPHQKETGARRRIWELEDEDGALSDTDIDPRMAPPSISVMPAVPQSVSEAHTRQPVADGPAPPASASAFARTASALRRAVSRPLMVRATDMPEPERSSGAESNRDAHLRANRTEPLRPPAAPPERVDLMSDARIEAIRPIHAPAASGNDAQADASARAPRPVRAAGRVKTRLLGFQHEDVSSKDLFDKTDQPGPSAGPVMFPVGWLVITAGEGRGASFALFNGVSQLGRGEDQAVQLDFGDTTISRQNHAAIAFDDELGSFFLGHGGKSNLVRLNGKPVLSTEPLNDGDTIRLGQTTLRFVALCGERFSWVGGQGGANEHVAAE